MNKAKQKHNSKEPSDLQGILRYVSIFNGQKFLIGIDYKCIRKGNFAMITREINLLVSLNIRVMLYFFNDESSVLSLVDIDDELFNQFKSSTLVLSTLTIDDNIQTSTHINDLMAKISGLLEEPSVILLLPKYAPIEFYKSTILHSLLSYQTPNKCIFLGRNECPIVNGERFSNISVNDLNAFISDRRVNDFPEWFLPYASLAVNIIKFGVDRVHIINLNVHNAILSELFDKVGIGVMIHANRYEILRDAVESDVNSLYHLTKNSVKKDTLLNRPIDLIRNSISQYRVYEIDGSIVACICMNYFTKDNAVEIGSVFVQPYYNRRGIGSKLVNYACEEALKDGYKMAFILTVNATKFFIEKCGFSTAKFLDLPSERQISYKNNQRQSYVLSKNLEA